MTAGRRIFLYYLCGVFAAAQLGKLAALAPLISRELHLGLAAMAALTSLIEVCGALFGGAAGRSLPRLGMRRALMLAVLSLALGAVIASFADTVWALAAGRLFESLGYLAIVVAAPVLISRTAPLEGQASAMALWSTFVPVGMAAGAWAYSNAADLGGWHWAQGLSVVCGVGLAGWLHASGRGAADVLDRATGRQARGGQHTGALIWVLVAAFGVYAIAEVGLLALLPTLLTQSGMTLACAGAWTAIAALANVPASIVGAWLMRRGVSLTVPMALSLGGSGVLYALTYRDGLAAEWRAAAAVGVNLFSGVFATLVFALLPRAAGSASRLSLVSGRLTQFGASGALAGPPLIGAIVEHQGWQAAGFASLALSLMAVPLALWAWRRLRSDAPALAAAVPR